MSCSACRGRNSTRLRDTTLPTVPVQKPTQNQTQPSTQTTATEQGTKLRGKLRFTGR